MLAFQSKLSSHAKDHYRSIHSAYEFDQDVFFVHIKNSFLVSWLMMIDTQWDSLADVIKCHRGEFKGPHEP